MGFSSKYVLGLIFILLVTIIWSLASVITQFIYTNENFQSPILLTYISSSLFSLYLVLWHVLLRLGYVKDNRLLVQRRNDNDNNNDKKDLSLYNPLVYDETTADNLHDNSINNDDNSNNSSNDYEDNIQLHSINRSSNQFNVMYQIKKILKPIPDNYTHEQILYAGLLLFPLWFISNCFYNYSLLLTSITSSTIISNFSGVFTLFFSWLFGIESVTKEKLSGLLICMMAIILVALSDEENVNDNNHSFIGDFLTLLGAMGYGLYTTILRIKVTSDDSVPMPLLLGYLGLSTAILCSPLILLMSLLHLDNLDKMTGAVFGFVLLNGFLDNVIADYLWARAVLLTSPTVATVGLSLTIPFAILCDFIIRGQFSLYSFIGAILFIIGFIILNINFDDIIYCRKSSRNRDNENVVSNNVTRNETVEL